jgi:nickel/cobalt transporter (NicO) family protein
MGEAVFYLASSFWAGAVHAATPGHGKTISAAYIVGARGRPVDAVILGVFVTLSHTSGILLVGLLASLGSAWLVPQRIEAYLALVMGLLVIVLGGWVLWTQRRLLGLALGISPAGYEPDHRHDHAQEHSHHAHEHAQAHDHDHHSHEHVHAHGHYAHHHAHAHADTHEHHAPAHAHAHAHGYEAGWHSHGWGTYHAHRLDLLSENRPKLGVLLALGIAGGLLPDPTALAILLASVSSGRLMLGLATVLVFSIGFASALVLVGLIAAQIGQRVLAWLDSIWALRLQLSTTLLIIGMGVVLTAQAARQLARLQGL